MKKLLAIFLLAVTLCLSLCACAGKETKDAFELFSEKTIEKELGDCQKEYDDEGKVIKAFYEGKNGFSSYVYEYEYDENNYLVKKTRWFVFEDGSMDEKNPEITVYEYDTENKLVIETPPYMADMGERTFENYLDSRGNVIKYIMNSENEEHFYHVEMEYDDNDNEIKYTNYDADGNMTGWTEIEYDDDGNEIKYTNYDADGNMTGWTETSYHSNGEEAVSTSYFTDGSINYQTKYNEDGIIIEEINTNNERYIKYEYGENDYKKEIYHDSEWNMTGYSELTGDMLIAEYDADGNIIQGTLEECNEAGLVVKSTFYFEGALSNYEVYEYNTEGNMIKCTYYNPDDSVAGYSVMDYYANGIKKSEARYDQSGNLEFDWQYNEDGIELESAWCQYGEDGSLSSKRVTKNDEQGHQLERIEYRNYDGNLTLDFRWVTEYDDEYNAIKEIRYDPEGNVELYWVNEYHDNGNQSKRTQYDADGNVMSEYKYDENGNDIIEE